MPTRDHRFDLLRRLTDAANTLMESDAYDPRPNQQLINDRVMLAHLCFKLGDALTLLGTSILNGKQSDASRELARRVVDLICIAEGMESLPSGAPTALT